MGLLAAIKRFAFSFLVAFNWVYAFFSRRPKLHGSRFARIEELTNLTTHDLDKEGSLILGVSHLNHVLRVKPVKTRREFGNLLVVAPIRGGKGLLATAQLLTWRHSVVVNDIKGDLFAQTAGYRAALGPVFVIDPTGVGHRFDPLSGKLTEDELFSSATHLLFRPDEGDGAIFTQRAIVMLTQIFLAARGEGSAPLPYVREAIRSGLAATAERLNAISPELATQFLDVALASPTSWEFLFSIDVACLRDRIVDMSFITTSMGKARAIHSVSHACSQCISVDITYMAGLRAEKWVRVLSAFNFCAIRYGSLLMTIFGYRIVSCSDPEVGGDFSKMPHVSRTGRSH